MNNLWLGSDGRLHTTPSCRNGEGDVTRSFQLVTMPVDPRESAVCFSCGTMDDYQAFHGCSPLDDERATAVFERTLNVMTGFLSHDDWLLLNQLLPALEDRRRLTDLVRAYHDYAKSKSGGAS